MEIQKRKSFFSGIPSWASALIAMIVIFFVAMGIPEQFSESAAGEVIGMIIWCAVNAICCFFIVKQNPKSIWYVPLIINAYFILPAIFENNNWKDWLFLFGTFALSIIASITGALVGKRKAVSENAHNPDSFSEA